MLKNITMELEFTLFGITKEFAPDIRIHDEKFEIYVKNPEITMNQTPLWKKLALTLLASFDSVGNLYIICQTSQLIKL